jgi:hemoglobin-like flavoprotein
MTSHDIALLRASFEKISPIAESAAALFYARLFEIEPSLRPLFHGDIAAQGRRLMTTVARTIETFDRLDDMGPELQLLGTGFGILGQYYVNVGITLLWTLEKILGPDFTPEVKTAWIKAYALFCTTMKDASHLAA